MIIPKIINEDMKFRINRLLYQTLPMELARKPSKSEQFRNHYNNFLREIKNHVARSEDVEWLQFILWALCVWAKMWKIPEDEAVRDARNFFNYINEFLTEPMPEQAFIFALQGYHSKARLSKKRLEEVTGIDLSLLNMKKAISHYRQEEKKETVKRIATHLRRYHKKGYPVSKMLEALHRLGFKISKGQLYKKKEFRVIITGEEDNVRRLIEEARGMGCSSTSLSKSTGIRIRKKSSSQ